jgi:hypothetical protein
MTTGLSTKADEEIAKGAGAALRDPVRKIACTRWSNSPAGEETTGLDVTGVELHESRSLRKN